MSFNSGMRIPALPLPFSANLRKPSRPGRPGRRVKKKTVSRVAPRDASLVDHFLEAPPPELGEQAGEILGTVLIEMVLLLFTEGIGNLITKLGEFARALRPLSRGVRA
ncbi:hypothetical protein [Variovorax sp. JS1663]|uniref:hypothetical protein n=1 Tax=Variovorax sp. JS1663 TaxID=1851577 RepID=UPI000B6F0D5A|nr:hypothetical protein [Variovorax sp. JS1663]OUM02004.1 hypothetical protein A8M77_12895 [Variovorax sp. JS1663]